MVLERAGLQYEIADYPWRRAKAMIRDGSAWAGFPFGDSDENRKDFDLSGSLYASQFLYFHREDNTDIGERAAKFSTLSDFRDYVFGGSGGYWYGGPEAFSALGIRTEWANDTDGLVKMLYNGRIDFFMEDQLVGWEAIRRLYPKESGMFGTLPQSAKEREYGLLVSRKYADSAALLKRFEDALEDMTKENAFAEVLP